ncbi:MAG: O-antigen ligase family protein [Bacteroidales bacterium]|nr:O-antigen ligase family protein [Bacteroidales bacterium]
MVSPVSKQQRKGIIVALVCVLLFVVANTLLLADENYLLGLLPLGIALIWLFFKYPEAGLLLTALATPFSIDVVLLGETELSLPTEPMLILLSLVFLFRVLLMRNYDLRLLRHPVSLLVLAMLGWMFITSCTSEMPLVSFKYTVARAWFVVPCYFAATTMLRTPQATRRFVWAYGLGLAVVVAITTYKTLFNFSDLQTMHRVMKPFYNDHTAYGCIIALFLPAAIGLAADRGERLWLRICAVVLAALLATGLVLSYCRAAWLSVAGALVVYLLIHYRVKLKWMLAMLALVAGLFFAFQGDLLYNMGKNKQDSSYELADQLKSISNISTDASNLERINRWASALRMWGERPVQGFGPGTYQFIYGSYQMDYQMTVISTNSGDLGNAHSEYIGPLSEQGVVGAGIVIALFLTVFATGIRVYRTAKDQSVRRMAVALCLCLFTYYVHGTLNNFLDTDKLSVPFWGMTAAIVALDVFSEKVPAARPRQE